MCLSLFLYDILSHNCKRFFTESRVHRSGALGTRPWHAAHPVPAALADCSSSLSSARAAVEKASVTATDTALAGPVAWLGTPSGQVVRL